MLKTDAKFKRRGGSSVHFENVDKPKLDCRKPCQLKIKNNEKLHGYAKLKVSGGGKKSNFCEKNL
jgi:hypothetical protein